MPRWVITKAMDALNDRGKSLKGAKVLVLGIAYKRDVDDMRESPSVALMELLEEKGAIVEYTDPHVPVFPKMREHHFDLSSVDPTPEKIAEYDMLMLATDHAKFDYAMFQQHAQLIIDTRGIYQHPADNVVKA